MLSKFEETYVKNVYEEIANHFDNTRQYTWSWISDFINSLPVNSYICDVGCGNGRNMTFPNYNFIGIDNCRAFIEICKSKNLEVIEANMTSIPLQNNKFDAIICIASFHHLYLNIEKINCLIELKRLIKDDGKILLSVWSKTQPKKTRRVFNNRGHNFVKWNKFGKEYERYYYIFDNNELENLFKIAGLLVLHRRYDCGNDIYILTKNK